jgi:hypothetical protein
VSGVQFMKAAKKKAETEKVFGYRKLVYAAIAVIIILASTFIIYTNLYQSPKPPKAAIIDQLNSSELSSSSRFPNSTFIQTAKELLYQRFSHVDYYSDNATVEQYRLLPSLGYKLIIWRAHSAIDEEGKYVAICSSERYNGYIPKKYEQYTQGQLTLCNITVDPVYYFAITPKFVEECMSGKFEDTVIILMSCNGLRQNYFKTADALIEKGVKVFISWNNWIDSSPNDHAITLLLQYLINENNTVIDALIKVNPPNHNWGGAALKYHPETTEVAYYRIPDYRQSNVTTNAAFMVAGLPKKHRIKLKLVC